MKRRISILRANLRCARSLWGPLPLTEVDALKRLTSQYGLSVSSGDIKCIEGSWYVTHSGLLRLADRRKCWGIQTRLVAQASDPAASRWVFRATVYKVSGSNGFVGYGDADPTNISPWLRGSELRIAETRAVSRALRKCYGIGLCSVEELGWSPGRKSQPEGLGETQSSSNGSNGSHGGELRLRDKLAMLIRKHNLDASLVKIYATDCCETKSLKDASRSAIESFIVRLEREVEESREGLVCKLNSFRVAPETEESGVER